MRHITQLHCTQTQRIGHLTPRRAFRKRNGFEQEKNFLSRSNVRLKYCLKMKMSTPKVKQRGQHQQLKL